MSLSSPLFALLAMVPILASLLLGAQLRIEHFQEVLRRPRALWVGLTGQYLLLPLLATVFYFLYPAPDDIGWAWFVLAAVPGGAISNMVTFLGRGRLSLSVLLTAFSTLSAVVVIPLWVNVGLWVVGAGTPTSLPIAGMVLGSFLFLVVPLGAGFAVGIWSPSLAERLRRLTRVAMLLLLVLGMAAYTIQRWEFIARDFHLSTLIGAALFHIATVGATWGLGWGAGLDRRDRFTVAIEAGVQNFVIAVLIAELLGRSDLVPFVGYYAIAMFFMLLVWVGFLGGGSGPSEAPLVSEEKRTGSSLSNTAPSR